MELHDVPANVRLQGAVVVRQIGQGHGPGADGATARTSGADPPRPGDLGLRRADCLHSSRFSTRTPLFVTVSIAAYCRSCRARSCVAAVPTVLLCAGDVWGCLGVQSGWCTFWVLRSGTIFWVFVAIREFYSGRATPPQSLSGSSIQKKQRFPGNLEIGCIRSTQGKTQDTGVVDENMTATVLSSALPARARGAPASTSGTTPRRRLRAALARRGGSTSTSSPPPKEVFQGQFGAWTVDAEDEREVFLYRLGLSVAAVSWAATGLSLLSPAAPAWFSAAGYAVGSFAFGGSLALIHIYVTPAKRFLQGLFLVGLLGSVFIFTREDCAR